MTDSPDQPQLELFVNADRPRLSAVVDSFEPARLTQARVLAEMTKAELAEQVGVSAAAIGQYESGVNRPRTDLLPVLSKVLGVPIEYFASGRPMGRLDAANAHFRSLRSTRAKDRAKAAAHAEQIWELTCALEKRVRFPDVDLPTVAEGSSPEAAAQVLRSYWGIQRGPVPHLGALMESRGIVVCLIPMTDDAVTRVSAYSTDMLGRPLVVITPEKVRSVYTFRFTCAHELGHLLLHANPLPGDRQQEREADQFAAELLTPRAEIEPLLPRTMRLAALDELGRQWGVSIESLIYRMGELNLVTETSIRRAHQRLHGTADFRRDEPLTSYPGEIPTLLRDAADVADRHGFSRTDLANELCWTERHVADALGDDADSRPRLSIVR
ncbi:helix-turn-helix domain-containing protein [Nocardia sp. NPDC057663]|uniref:helix-turn-helix domain-containing protein n=1 Tax=Nocardia sp. NPDC057663 TaxID=3346201 RepID=UPI00367004EE